MEISTTSAVSTNNSSHTQTVGVDSQKITILIADDSNTDRLLLEAILRKQQHLVVIATNGVEAVEVFQRERPGIVLLDALMPEMDGFEAAEKIKILAGEEFVPIIFLTSLQEADSLARCLDAGGDDFLSKPYNSIILQAKIDAFIRMRDMHLTLQNQRDEIGRHNTRMLREQEVAKRVFDKVAHAGCLDAPNIQYALSPIAVFNGDVALAGVGPTGNLLVLLGDFTGHGLDAAIGAMPMAQTFYSMLEKGFSLREILREINVKLHEILPVGVFCCALVTEIDFISGVARVWNGGLPDCMIYHPRTGAITRLKSSHLAFGILANIDFSNVVETYEVEPGDRIYIWSDGIHEAENKQGEMYGEARLLAVFERNQQPEKLFLELNVSVDSFIMDETLEDDVSLIEVTVVKPEDFSVAVPSFAGGQEVGPKDWSLKYDLRPATLKDFDPLPLLLQVLMQVPFLRPFGSQIYTVMAELYANALEHGVLGLDSALKRSPEGFSEYYSLRNQSLLTLVEGLISIQLHYTGTMTGGQLSIEIEDSGKGFDFQRIFVEQSSKADEYSGRGIFLLRSLCDSVVYSGVGNQVCAIFVWGDQEAFT
ncbi:MAG: SpoIIE family protein phosphatase [Pseudomonadales bacterium]